MIRGSNTTSFSKKSGNSKFNTAAITAPSASNRKQYHDVEPDRHRYRMFMSYSSDPKELVLHLSPTCNSGSSQLSEYECSKQLGLAEQGIFKYNL